MAGLIKKMFHAKQIAALQLWWPIALLAIAASSGCSEAFEPKGPYQSGLVVYSVLSNRSDSLIVRVYSTYDPAGNNPFSNSSDTEVKNARVVVSTDSTSVVLSSDIIPRTDKNRYSSDITAYVLHPFRLKKNAAYAISVTSPAGNASAKIVAPDSGLVQANNAFVLKAPEKYTDDITANVRLSSVSIGYIVRLYLEYDAKVGSQPVHVRVEVPDAIRSSTEVGFEYSYPMLVRRITDPPQISEIVYFTLDAYKAFLLDQVTKYGEIKLTSATFIMTQVEPNLYQYYNIANGYLDPYSIRTDLPDFSNISGGFGLFGAMRDDSLVVDLH